MLRLRAVGVKVHGDEIRLVASSRWKLRHLCFNINVHVTWASLPLVLIFSLSAGKENITGEG